MPYSITKAVYSSQSFFKWNIKKSFAINNATWALQQMPLNGNIAPSVVSLYDCSLRDLSGKTGIVGTPTLFWVQMFVFEKHA